MSPGWLTAQPFAHRGLHDAAAGVIENTGPAFEAAILGGYGIECDVQLSADGEAMVHHDDALGRLTQGNARLNSLSAAELGRVPFKNGTGRILTLGELCSLVGGRAPFLVEIKGHFDGDRRLVSRTAEVLRNYRGPVAAMSFDPGPIEALRSLAPSLARGIVAEHCYDHPEWSALGPSRKRELANLLHWPSSRPDFIAYAGRDLPAVAPLAARWLFGRPLLCWTIRSEMEHRRVRRWADQIIFEGFRP
ncbi:MAG: glycerophosphodiester phosphodiesterase [Pseudolabrys sp.]|nr:glycerophosphodiester phosphodiesterase [Pseudolabrys sp.]